jgi:rare lipoprotein A
MSLWRRLSVCVLVAAALQGCATLEMPKPDEQDRARTPKKRPPVAAPPPEPEPAPPAEEPPPPVAVEPELPPGVEEGLASYYSDKLKGRRTASGKRYDPRRETCAHRTHPFGTKLTITVVSTGKHATCRVTDRGPFVKGRIVDVSRKVAQKLGIMGKGVVKARVEVAGGGSS